MLKIKLHVFKVLPKNTEIHTYIHILATNEADLPVESMKRHTHIAEVSSLCYAITMLSTEIWPPSIETKKSSFLHCFHSKLKTKHYKSLNLSYETPLVLRCSSTEGHQTHFPHLINDRKHQICYSAFLPTSTRNACLRKSCKKIFDSIRIICISKRKDIENMLSQQKGLLAGIFFY